jgi:hypothetical protein
MIQKRDLKGGWMKELRSTQKSAIIVRSFGYFTSAMSLVFLFACIAAVPLIIKYAKSDEGYVSKVDVPASADRVYQEAIRRAESRPDVTILKRDDAERFLEATDGVQKASVKVTPEGPEKTELVVTADVPKTEEGKEAERAKEKELSLQIVKGICDGLGVKCEVGQR